MNIDMPVSCCSLLISLKPSDIQVKVGWTGYLHNVKQTLTRKSISALTMKVNFDEIQICLDGKVNVNIEENFLVYNAEAIDLSLRSWNQYLYVNYVS